MLKMSGDKTRATCFAVPAHQLGPFASVGMMVGKVVGSGGWLLGRGGAARDTPRGNVNHTHRHLAAALYRSRTVQEEVAIP